MTADFCWIIFSKDWTIPLVLRDTANLRPLRPTNKGGGQKTIASDQCHVGQVHSKKVAWIELKMAEVIQKRKITQMLQFSAQSEQLCESFTLNALLGYCKKSLML